MVIWISWNIDIRRSLNSHDIFPRRKFQNRAQTHYRPGPILSLPTVTFEFHAKMAEETDLDKCNFGTLQAPWPRPCIASRSYLCTCGWGLPTHQFEIEIGKTFCGRTDGHDFQYGSRSMRTLPGDDLKTEWWGAGTVICLHRGRNN